MNVQRYADWVPKPDRTALESLIAADVRALTAESDQIGRRFAGRHDVAANDFRALLHVMVAETAGSPLTAGELRARMGMSGAAITYLVERMIASGHFSRESDPADRRKVILRVADDGMSVARGFFTPLADHTHRATGRSVRQGLGRRTPDVRRAHRRHARVPRPTGRGGHQLNPVECRFLEVEPVQHRPQHLVVARMCLTCGHVGCCDSSPHQHASEHFRGTGQPVMRSVEPGPGGRAGGETERLWSPCKSAMRCGRGC